MIGSSAPRGGRRGRRCGQKLRGYDEPVLARVRPLYTGDSAGNGCGLSGLIVGERGGDDGGGDDGGGSRYVPDRRRGVCGGVDIDAEV